MTVAWVVKGAFAQSSVQPQVSASDRSAVGMLVWLLGLGVMRQAQFLNGNNRVGTSGYAKLHWNLALERVLLCILQIYAKGALADASVQPGTGKSHLASMAVNQPALQYPVQTDADLENKLCEKGLKGAMCLTCKVSLY